MGLLTKSGLPAALLCCHGLMDYGGQVSMGGGTTLGLGGGVPPSILDNPVFMVGDGLYVKVMRLSVRTYFCMHFNQNKCTVCKQDFKFVQTVHTCIQISQ